MSHTTTPAELLTRPTDNPCPPWCGDRAGHGYDSLALDEGRLARSHGIDFGHLDPQNRRSGLAVPEVWVSISAVEEVDSDEQSNLTVEEPLIRLYAENANLTAEEARRVATWLNDAAHRLDLISGASR